MGGFWQKGKGQRGVSLGPAVAFLAWHQALCLQTGEKGNGDSLGKEKYLCSHCRAVRNTRSLSLPSWETRACFPRRGCGLRNVCEVLREVAALRGLLHAQLHGAGGAQGPSQPLFVPSTPADELPRSLQLLDLTGNACTRQPGYRWVGGTLVAMKGESEPPNPASPSAKAAPKHTQHLTRTQEVGA